MVKSNPIYSKNHKKMANEILKTIIRQLNAQGIYGKDYLKVDETTLRVQQKIRSNMKRKRGADIKYNKGTDLYDVDAFEVNLDFNSKDFGKTKRKKYQGMYWDNLKNIKELN